MATIDLICSFCGRGAKEVDKLIAGPGAYICNECGDLVAEIFSEGSSVSEILNLKWSEFTGKTVSQMLEELELTVDAAVCDFLEKCREIQRTEISGLDDRLKEIDEEIKQLQKDKQSLEQKLSTAENKKSMLQKRKV